MAHHPNPRDRAEVKETYPKGSMRTTTIVLAKEEMKFSAGHFTIFGPGSRENLHGHNFTIEVELEGVVNETEGMLADYDAYKKRIIEQCSNWNETFLLPDRSPYLAVSTDKDGNVTARFGDEVLQFLARDVTILPVANVSVEELSRLFGEGLVGDARQLRVDRIFRIRVRCGSGPGQTASWDWQSDIPQ